MSIALLPQLVLHTVFRRTLRCCTQALLLATLLVACATTRPAETDVKLLAQARWDALLAGDIETAYNMYSPGYRSSHSRVDFELALRLRRVQWVSAQVQKSSCEAAVCSVVTLIGYKVVEGVPKVPSWENKKNMTERWVRTGGQWWFLPDD